MLGLLLDSAPLDVFGQMALDEALARARPETFCLRFFRWRGVGATCGYAQRIRAVAEALPPDVADFHTRRPTGGGLVVHRDDLTFSCVFPAPGILRPPAIYRRLHAAILEGLRAAGIAARLCAPGGDPAPHGPQGALQCFVRPVAQDLLTDGGKILGGAIRRFGDTVLYQGSLQLPDARARAAEFEAALLASLARDRDLRWERRAPEPAVQAGAEALVAKYRSAEWIRRY